MKKESLFFDVHMHAFNLSHAGLLAFINRALLNKKLTLEDIYEKKIGKIFWIFLKSILSKQFNSLFSSSNKKENKDNSLANLVNTLSIFENNIARQFQYIELDYLLMCGNQNIENLINGLTSPVNYDELNINLNQEWLNSGGKFCIGEQEYNKVILTPFMMDFNSKGFTGLPKDKIHYNLPPSKTIKDQTIDLFTGIKEYYENSSVKLLEIYPFMALNTENLELGDEPIQYEKKKLYQLLDQHFKDFKKDDSGEQRYEYLSNKLNKFKNTEENNWFNPLSSECYHFAGIKVYPPLGFDPWPDGDDQESKQKMKKVSFFYKYCADRNIPITTHCSNGGFQVASKEDSQKFTNPERWSNVLVKYNNLKLNFAHDGICDDKVDSDWNRTILEYVFMYENVYFDVADNVYEKDYFNRLFSFIKQQNYPPEKLKRISEKMLFGTDFMMSLLKLGSYHDYLVKFSESPDFENQFVDKHTLCSKNSFEFIFGK
jgi:hypothetical protein